MIDTTKYYTPGQLSPAITALCNRWAGADHASLSEKRFIQLTEAVLYCTDTALTERFTADEKARAAGSEAPYSEITALQTQQTPALPDAEALYQEGLAALQTKAQKLVLAYNALLPRFNGFGNRCLTDTVLKGYPAFFRKYNRIYAPQDTLLTLDYPILDDDTLLTGLHRVYAYFRSICIEQRFFAALGPGRCLAVLEQIFPDGQLKRCVENLVLPIWCRMLYALPGFTEAAAGLREILLQTDAPDRQQDPAAPEAPSVPPDHPCALLEQRLSGQIFGQDAALQNYLALALPGIILQGVPQIFTPEKLF